MTAKPTYCFLLFSFCCQIAFAQIKLSKTDMVKWDFKQLIVNKQQLQKGNALLKPAYEQLLHNADSLLGYKPVSVMQKKDIPPSGNKHDYMSLAPYWWPDPNKPNGIPYIRRDGEVNPEVKNYPDKEQMPKLCENVNTLALAYYYSGNENYAKHAANLMRVWFLDTATRMNPNLNFGQAVKGITNGRAEGVIDTRQFIYALDAIQLLKKSSHWTADDQRGLQKWMTEFLIWLRTSKIGTDEMNTKNNHAIWYDAQTLSMAIFIDSIDLAKKIIAVSKERLDKQMNEYGLFPLELERTTSLHYSVFILNAFNVIAELSEQIGVDYFQAKTVSGKSLKMAFDSLMPYLLQQKNWTYTQIKPFAYTDAFPLLLSAERRYGYKGSMDNLAKILNADLGRLQLKLL
jgi:Alginate lyase